MTGQKVFALTEHKGGGLRAVFYVDGQRVSRAHYEEVKNAAHGPSGRLDSYATSGRELPGGKTRRTNHCTAHVPSWFKSAYGEDS